jgi:hypothetical protein
MSPVWSTVIREITVDVAAPAGGVIRMPVALRYDTSDPFAIHADFRCGEGDEVTWVFGRELLTEGVSGPTGEGDVRIWPAQSQGEEVLRMALISPDGEAVLQTSAEAVLDFLSATYASCQSGTEAQLLDLDTALEHLLTS